MSNDPAPKASAVVADIPAKRCIEMAECPDADAEFQSFMVQNKISKWWHQIHDRLGITSIQELRYIGKANVLTYLSGLPALPVLKLSELADS
jgi:hypothetical protein